MNKFPHCQYKSNVVMSIRYGQGRAFSNRLWVEVSVENLLQKMQNSVVALYSNANKHI